MAADKTDVDYCNRALALLGESEINELTASESVTSAICTQLYDGIVERLLSTHNWSFATRYITLSQETTVPPSPWTHQFALPADLVRFWTTDYPGEDWLIRAHPSEDRQILLAKRSGLKASYIYRANEGTFSPQFQTALVHRLAADLAVPIAGVDRGGPLAQFYESKARDSYGLAATIDSSQSPAAQLGDQGDLWTARGGGRTDPWDISTGS